MEEGVKREREREGEGGGGTRSRSRSLSPPTTLERENALFSSPRSLSLFFSACKPPFATEALPPSRLVGQKQQWRASREKKTKDKGPSALAGSSPSPPLFFFSFLPPPEMQHPPSGAGPPPPAGASAGPPAGASAAAGGRQTLTAEQALEQKVRLMRNRHRLDGFFLSPPPALIVGALAAARAPVSLLAPRSQRERCLCPC